MPEGTAVTNARERVGERGVLGRTTESYITAIGHHVDRSKRRIKLLNRAKKVIKSSATGVVGIIADGGRTDQPWLGAVR